jgi:hypothetical protein
MENAWCWHFAVPPYFRVSVPVRGIAVPLACNLPLGLGPGFMFTAKYLNHDETLLPKILQGRIPLPALQACGFL